MGRQTVYLHTDKLSSLVDNSTDEVNISNLGHYRSEEDSDEANVSTPMIMDSDLRSPQRDGLALPNKAAYGTLYYVTQGIGILLVLVTAIWLGRYIGGFGFASAKQVFNYHPILMIIGFVFIYGNAMLIYRTLRGELKPKLKLMHAILMGSIMVICSVGSLSVFYFHVKASIPHFYSLHSWLGISTWTFFLAQFSGGFAAYLFPGASYNVRTLMMPFHRFFGVATFVLAAATCLTGLNEKAIFALNGQDGYPKYTEKTAAGFLVNFVALILVAYVSLVVYLVTKPDFKRQPLPEEQVINLNFDLTSNN